MLTRILTIAITLNVLSEQATAIASTSAAISETVYVEAPVDTDQDGSLDKIYLQVTRPEGGRDLPTIFTISPYAMGGNSVRFHDVDVDRLPQDDERDSLQNKRSEAWRALVNKGVAEVQDGALARGYASVSAHSVGTGYSEGCPTVGDEAETLAAKAVIDWLNGRARAFDRNGREITASWANGAVGMTGVSYNGTLPNMVATTGVDGLKAIIPVAAISSWYNYYRANGLVVGPGGYIGEDADILGKFIVRRGACRDEMNELSNLMGREHGDFTEFWQQRDYISKAANVRAAVFIMHGQADWNVRQRHAIEWWEALEGVVPRRMWLHRGGHSHPSRSDLQAQIWAWFDHYVKGVNNGVENEPVVEVESREGVWSEQMAWPNEDTYLNVLYMNGDHALVATAGSEGQQMFVDAGKRLRLEDTVAGPTADHNARLVFVSEPQTGARLMSGTAKVQIGLSVLNRMATNITVAIIDYDEDGRGRVVTRGWADPQNHLNLQTGELLVPGREYLVSFPLEPKQYTFAAGHRIGVLVTATDYDHTLRPEPGTQIAVAVGRKSFVELHLSEE